MKNSIVISNLINGKKGMSSHLATDGRYLVNYSTVLCEVWHESKKAFVNVRKYSNTTSRIVSNLKHQLSISGYEIIEFDGPECNYWNCGYQGAVNMNMSDMDRAIRRYNYFMTGVEQY